MSKLKVILTAKHGRPSTIGVYEQMNSGLLIQRRELYSTKYKPRKLVKTYYRVFDNNRVPFTKYPTFDFDGCVVVRWGTRESINTGSGNIVYNKSEDIRKATDKLLSRQIFEKSGVNAPKLVTRDNFEESDFPVVRRPHLHSKGRYFAIVSSGAELIGEYDPNRYYYSKFIDKDKEFRVHVAHGKAIAVMEKTKPSDNNPAWNRAQNDTDPFTYVNWDKVNRAVIVEAIKAVASLGLDFGGVDVLLKDGVAYVIEVNTAPTLNTSPYVSKKWGQYFDWLFTSDTRRKHWDFNYLIETKKPGSLIWKNKQLRGEEEIKEVS